MIEPHELRIGNLVRLKHTIMNMVVKEIRVGPTNTFLSLLPYGCVDKHENRIQEAIDGVMGIELTFELIQQVGFKMHNMFDCIVFYANQDRVELVCCYPDDESDNMIATFNYDKKPKPEGNAQRDIQSLHDLQNFWWALTGKELKVKL